MGEESGHLDLGKVQSLTLIRRLAGRSAGTIAASNGAGIDFPAWGGGTVTGNSPPWPLYLASQDIGGSIAHSQAQPALSKSWVASSFSQLLRPLSASPAQAKHPFRTRPDPSARDRKESHQAGGQRVSCPTGDEGLPEQAEQLTLQGQVRVP